MVRLHALIVENRVSQAMYGKHVEEGSRVLL
jgi:hypothetical protein